MCPRACAPQEKSPQWEALSVVAKSSPQVTATRERPQSNKDRVQPKLINLKKNGWNLKKKNLLSTDGKQHIVSLS